MKDRVLKVETLFVSRRWKERDTSQIRLKGLWLAQAGFSPGDKVQVMYQKNGELLIKRIGAG